MVDKPQRKPELPGIIAERKKMLTARMRNYFQAKRRQETQSMAPDAIDRIEAMAREGKMLRGIFVTLAFELSGREVTDKVLDAAMAMEFAHMALLVHDDIMDNDQMRRGMEAMHAQYALEGKRKGAANPLHYGISQAISIGDAANFMGLECIGKAIEGHPSGGKIISLMGRELVRVGYAQMADVFYGQTGREPDESEILAIYQHKTARYSFTLPFLVGGLLGELPEAELATLDRLGEEMGIVFQIRDDELGVFGDEEKIGKPVGSDIRENKKTLLRSYLLQKADPEERNRLLAIYGSRLVKVGEIAYVRNLIDKYNVQEIVNVESRTHEERARDILDKSSLTPDRKQLFGEILRYVVVREL